MDDHKVRERVARVEVLLEQTEGLADPAARDTATELAQGLLDLYGEGLARIVARVAERDDGELAAALAADELVAHLLLLHGLHPIALEERVRGALDGVRPYLESHGGGVELLGVAGGVVRLRLEGSCNGCPSSTATLKLAIEDAIRKAAPDVEEIVADGAAAPAPALLQIETAAPGLLPVDTAARGPLLQIEMAAPAPRPAWAVAAGMPDLAAGETALRDVAGEPVLMLRLDERAYAYRPTCPGCGTSLGGVPLHGAELRCPECGNRYDVRHAGRCADAPRLHLEPVPLLVDGDGQVKLALGSVA